MEKSITIELVGIYLFHLFGDDYNYSGEQHIKTGESTRVLPGTSAWGATGEASEVLGDDGKSMVEHGSVTTSCYVLLVSGNWKNPKGARNILWKTFTSFYIPIQFFNLSYYIHIHIYINYMYTYIYINVFIYIYIKKKYIYTNNVIYIYTPNI